MMHKLCWVGFFVIFSFTVNAVEGRFLYEQFQNLTPEEKLKENSLSVHLFSLPDQMAGLEAGWEVDARYYDQEKYLYSVPEVYIGYGTGAGNLFAIGRKKLDWKYGENLWSLGYINSNQGFTLLSTKEEGLTGAHIEWQTGSFQTSLFASYIYIPELNPNYEIKDGRVESASEWVRLPPSKTTIRDSEVPVYYEVDRPDTKDVVYKESVGVKSSVRWRGGEAGLYGLYKPENKLRIHANAYYDQSDRKEVVVTAAPEVHYHYIYGLGAKQSIGAWDYLLNVFSVRPRKGEQVYFETEYYTLRPTYLRKDFAEAQIKWESPYTTLTASFLQLLNTIEEGDDFFTDYPKWRQAFGLSLSYYMSDALRWLFNYRYDFSKDDNIISGEFSYRFVKSMMLSLGVELIKAPNRNSYWYPYQNHDRIYSGFSYFF